MFSTNGFLRGLTRWINATLSGDPCQAFSTRVAVEAEDGKRFWVIMEATINLVFALVMGERDHCRMSRLDDLGW